MEGGYDEIIPNNPFYAELKNEYGNLFQHCISQSWIICVPRIGSLNSRVFTLENFCAHILVPSEELPRTHYNTLTEKQVTVTNSVITLDVTKGLPLQSHILFEETFYTEDYMKYKVWCIETPLEPTANRDNISKVFLVTINDCIDLLWTQAAGRQVLDQIEGCVHTFLKKHNTLPLTITPLKDLVNELYTQCIQIALQNRRLREKSRSCKQVLENIKLAVESYMQYLLFDSLFKPICTSCAYEDSHLNKKIRNMCDIQLRDLDIKQDLYYAVPKAKQIISKIDSYNTVLEKLVCVKQSLNTLKRKDKSDNYQMLTADDLLPVFVFLIIKSGIPNWYSQLTYMKEFCFSGIGKHNGDECNFLITTLEAIIEHIQSGALTGPPDPESYYYETNVTDDNQKRNSLTESVSTGTNSSEESLEYVFELIKANQAEQVRVILEKNQKQIEQIQQADDNVMKLSMDDDLSNDDDSDTDIYHKLCHPLCNCKKCCHKISMNLLKTCATVMSRDSHGLTPLHMACIYGKATIVELLIELEANVNATDLNECTPLHYAASRGHQNVLLLLIHSGADINRTNIDKNTPLHLSVNNGHMNCVKALVYFAEHSRKELKINCTNESGNTPIHMASKWGYEGIVRLLIENGAEPSLQNKFHKTAFDYAHNLKILQVLKSCTPDLYEYIHITNTDIKELNIKSDNPMNVKLQMFNMNSNDSNALKTVENLKVIDRILKTISYGDVKLACFYMNIDYSAYSNADDKSNKSVCHPLCECHTCRGKIKDSKSEFNVNCSDSNGLSPLHLAAHYGLDELCNILIINKANVHCRNKKGQTPLHLAAYSNKTAVMRLLINNGANIDAVDSFGNTPLHDASQKGNIGAVKVLMSYNPDTTLLNGNDQSALDIAKEKIYLTIIDLIEKCTTKV